MGQIGKIIAQSAALTLPYSDRLVAGIDAGMFARLARPGGAEIKSNHPAFVFGHLALYPSRVTQLLGLPAGATAVPAGWDELFKNGAECRDDPHASIYPPKDEIMRVFSDSYKAALGAVTEADDAALAATNPSPGRLGEIFPTVGSVFGFYLSGHAQSHFGQVSAWRRMMGLSPA
ncbi:MAG: DinB family protein [Phycisphaerales bacterium]|nr:DinB family protein [Phycisphaerales bacterium]